MDADNLIFSSKIDPEVEDVCFDMLLQQFSDENFDKVYVQNVMIAPNEILFLVERSVRVRWLIISLAKSFNVPVNLD